MPRTRHSRHICALFPSLQEAILPGLCFPKFRLNILSIYYLHLFLFPQLGHLRAVCCRQLPFSNSQGKTHIHYFIFIISTFIGLYLYIIIYIKLILFFFVCDMTMSPLSEHIWFPASCDCSRPHTLLQGGHQTGTGGRVRELSHLSSVRVSQRHREQLVINMFTGN